MKAGAPRDLLATARNPLDFRLDDALHQAGQIVVEPGFQHRPQHFLDEIFQRPRIVAEHGMGEGVEGGFDGRARQDLLRRSRASGSAISSVSSNTSPSGKDGRISASDVASSRPASIASMSSWLLDTAGASAGAAAGGAGLTGGGAAFAAATCAAGMADGGMSFITSALTAGAAAAGFAGVAGLESFSAAAGFASSSAMIRRINAKISSIEGSWTFAACVISDSTSSTPSSMRFTPSATGFAGSGCAGRDFHRTSLTCPQLKRRSTHRAGSRPCSGHRSVAAKDANTARIALLPPGKVRHGNN